MLKQFEISYKTAHGKEGSGTPFILTYSFFNKGGIVIVQRNLQIFYNNVCYMFVFPETNRKSVTMYQKWKAGMMQNSLEMYGRPALKLMRQSRDQN